MDYGRPALVDRLAADYVAGTLRGAARRRLESLLPAHPGLMQAVERWQAMLMPMTEVVVGVEPPERVWTAIERRLGLATLGSQRSAVVTAGRQGPRRWWQWLGFWQAFSGTAVAAAVLLAILLSLPPEAEAPVIVVLQATGGPDKGQGGFVAAVGADGRTFTTRPISPVVLAQDRALELWAVPRQAGAPPTSLGVIARDAPSILTGRSLPAGTASLAVSEEPPGGSPTGAPTGPVLWAGPI